jgi:hypothetical protein
MPLSQSPAIVEQTVALPVLILTSLPASVVFLTAFYLWYLNKWH